MVELGLFDWSIWLVYLVLIGLVLWIYSGSRMDDLYSKYFILGFGIKVLGGLCFTLVYIYYYGFGDTFLYHSGASVLADNIVNNPGAYYELMASENGQLPGHLRHYETVIPYSRTSEEWYMVKLLSPINFIAFNSYLVVSLLISTISFYGSWKLFRVFNDIFKDRSKLSFIAAFLIPSAFFWGSGVLKDSVTVAALNILIFQIYFSITQKKFGIWIALGMIINIYVIFMLKSYVILAFLPCLTIILYLVFQSKIKSPVLKFAFKPAMLAIFSIFIYFTISALSESSQKYSLESLESQAKGFHSWHTTTAGSAYNLGVKDYTATSVISKIPAALNVTFFRPYLWESRNIVMIISALESLTLLALFIVGIIKWRARIFKSFAKNPYLIGFLIYCLFFGFAVGFTSYNFGALMRYKIPISSIIFFISFVMVYKSKEITEASVIKY